MKIWQNDDTNVIIGKKWEMVSKNILQKCSSNHAKQLQPWKILCKNQVKMLKKAIKFENGGNIAC